MRRDLNFFVQKVLIIFSCVGRYGKVVEYAYIEIYWKVNKMYYK